jgi:hypothetical protein
MAWHDDLEPGEVHEICTRQRPNAITVLVPEIQGKDEKSTFNAGNHCHFFQRSWLFSPENQKIIKSIYRII